MIISMMYQPLLQGQQRLGIVLLKDQQLLLLVVIIDTLYLHLEQPLEPSVKAMTQDSRMTGLPPEFDPLQQ
jgi:hypothetical protein